MLGAAALIGIPVLAFGIYIAVNFVLPSIFTTPSVTGVPTARSNNLDACAPSRQSAPDRHCRPQ